MQMRLHAFVSPLCRTDSKWCGDRKQYIMKRRSQRQHYPQRQKRDTRRWSPRSFCRLFRRHGHRPDSVVSHEQPVRPCPVWMVPFCWKTIRRLFRCGRAKHHQLGEKRRKKQTCARNHKNRLNVLCLDNPETAERQASGWLKKLTFKAHLGKINPTHYCTSKPHTDKDHLGIVIKGNKLRSKAGKAPPSRHEEHMIRWRAARSMALPWATGSKHVVPGDINVYRATVINISIQHLVYVLQK